MAERRSSSFGGGELLYFTWEPSLEETEQALMNVADYVANVEDPLMGARRIAMEDMQHHFDTETDPYGVKWEPLTDEYEKAKRAKGYPDHILVRDEDLMKGATSQEAWDIIGDDLVFNANALPMSKGKDPVNYGLVHQGSRTKTPMKAREFIGLTDEAMFKIDALFEAWYSRANEIWINPRTGFTYTRHPAGAPGSIGGRFSGSFNPEF